MTSIPMEVQRGRWARRFQSGWRAPRCRGVAMKRLWLALMPELREFPPEQQARALKMARKSELEPLELVGMAVWLVPVVTLAKYILSKASLGEDAFATLVMNVFVIVPLLVVFFAPIHIRRLRRGLREQLSRQGRT